MHLADFCVTFVLQRSWRDAASAWAASPVCGPPSWTSALATYVDRRLAVGPGWSGASEGMSSWSRSSSATTNSCPAASWRKGMLGCKGLGNSVRSRYVGRFRNLDYLEHVAWHESSDSKLPKLQQMKTSVLSRWFLDEFSGHFRRLTCLTKRSRSEWRRTTGP